MFTNAYTPAVQLSPADEPLSIIKDGGRNKLLTGDVVDQSMNRDIIKLLTVANHHLSLLSESNITTDEI